MLSQTIHHNNYMYFRFRLDILDGSEVPEVGVNVEAEIILYAELEKVGIIGSVEASTSSV